MPKQLNSRCKELVASLLKYFEEELKNNGPLIPLSSVRQIIDGHKVVINETEYKDEGANGGAYFKVRIIDVKPDSTDLTTEKEAESVTPETRDRESMENSSENEITKTNETPLASENIETFDEVDATPFRRRQPYGNYYYNYWDDIEPLYPIESNDINAPREPLPIDLSNDIYVNELLARSGAPTNPDAEVFDVNSPPTSQFERMTTR